MPAEDLVITLICRFTDGSNIHNVRKEITLKGMYLLMDGDGRIVKREGISTSMLSTSSFTPEGTLWITKPVTGEVNKHNFEAKIFALLT